MGKKSTSSERVRREEFSLAKHDKQFKEWKVLIGSRDWEEHKAGKDGVARYHIQNLPQDYFGPGVYELGLIPPAAISGRLISSDDVTVVYVGQAEMVRQRLQIHGTGLSHLGPRAAAIQRTESKGRYNFAWLSKDGRTAEEPYLSPKSLERERADSLQKQRQGAFKGLGGLSMVKEWEVERKGREGRGRGKRSLLEDAFQAGYTVVFRWAKAANRDSAKSGETQLLNFFDYAWNLHENGDRRPSDVLGSRVKKSEPQASCFCFKDPVVGVVLDLKNGRVDADVKPSSPRMHWQPSELRTPSRSAPQAAVGCPRGFVLLLGQIGRGKPQQPGSPFDKFTKRQSLAGGGRREGGRTVPWEVQRRMSQSGSFLEGVVLEDMPNLLAGQTVTVGVCGTRLGGGESCSAAPVSGRKRCARHKGMRASVHGRA